jgi:hypothetical protein
LVRILQSYGLFEWKKEYENINNDAISILKNLTSIITTKSKVMSRKWVSIGRKMLL